MRNLFNWVNQNKNSIVIFSLAIILPLFIPVIIYYGVSLITEDLLRGYINTNIVIIDSLIYMVIDFIITIVLIVLLLKHIFSYTWSMKCRTVLPIENGIIDKNLDDMTVGNLMERLEDFDEESLILLKDNHIVIIAKDSIKLKQE